METGPEVYHNVVPSFGPITHIIGYFPRMVDPNATEPPSFTGEPPGDFSIWRANIQAIQNLMGIVYVLPFTVFISLTFFTFRGDTYDLTNPIRIN